MYSPHSELYQFQIQVLSVQSVRESTRARVMIHYIPYPMASFPYCCRTNKIYNRIKFLCTIFPHSCTLVTFFILLLLLLLKKVSSARLGESDIHPISPKTPAPQCQPIDRKKRKGKRAQDYIRDRAAQANKEALALLLKPASPTPSKTELARSFQKDNEKGIKVREGHIKRNIK